MKLVDANILIYAVHQRAAQHEQVRRWWETALADDEPIGLTWTTILAFLRLTTRVGVFHKPLAVSDALRIVDQWLTHPNVRLVFEAQDHWQQLKGLLAQVGTAGNLTTDAHLAAIAKSNSASIVSCDVDFRRFTQLQCENPLVS